MKSKYEGICKKCNKKIEKGQNLAQFKKTWMHKNCVKSLRKK